MVNKNNSTNEVVNEFGERRHDGKNPSAHESQSLKETVKAFFRIAIPYWKTKDSIVAWFQVFGIALFTTLTIYLAKAFNDWYKEFWDFIQDYNVNGFIGGLILFTFLATCHVVTVVYKSYIKSALIIRWRRWLNKYYVDRYLQDGTYYRLQLTDIQTDNPDQRISEDLHSFVALTIDITVNVITSFCMLITFSIILWGLSESVEMEILNTKITLPDGYLFYLALVYSIIGTIITFIIGKPLVLLNFRQQRYEADYRYSLVRLRENAESVALYKGEHEENRRFSALFKDVVANYVHLITKTKALNFFVFGCAQTAVIFPILIASPLYFAKILTIGSLMQINSAFGRVYDSLSTIMDIFPQLANWKAVIDRLSLFENSINKAIKLPKPYMIYKGDAIQVRELSIKKPNNDLLIDNLNICLEKGDSLLIKGSSGRGKSTLLRAIAGIWPYAEGDIILPMSKKILFLSQRTYMPLGSLRDAIYYPSTPDGNNKSLFELLELVGLRHLINRIDVIDQWSNVLSLGEQQRIAFLRAFINKPDVIFMDEVTSALDEQNEKKLYTMLKNSLSESIIISVGHRNTLTKFHNKLLDLNGDTIEIVSTEK